VREALFSVRFVYSVPLLPLLFPTARITRITRITRKTGRIELLVLGRVSFGWFLSFRVPRAVAIWIPARAVYTKMQKPAERSEEKLYREARNEARRT
jgi:hypothetical protein